MAVYTVAQVTSYLKDSLDSNPLLNDLWVKGEVSNYLQSSAGHKYFTIKDEESQLRCAMFRTKHVGTFFHNGEAIIAHGRLSLYPVRGELQFYVDLVQPEGTGALALEFERLRAQLEKEGLFEPTRKRTLPIFPQRVGVITSPTGAVFHDICNVLERRYPLLEIVLSPATVQGIVAEESIVEALHILNDLEGIDVIILARGGGSLEELWPFNTEAVVKAIYSSRVPVVSGVGHETDTTLSDLVADLRAPTPSAAAELIAPNVVDLQYKVNAYQQTAINAVSNFFRETQIELESTSQRVARQAPPVDQYSQGTDDLANRIAQLLNAHITLTRERFTGVEQRLQVVDPKSVLSRGYAMVAYSPSGTPLRKIAHVKQDELLKITLQDGNFKARTV